MAALTRGSSRSEWADIVSRRKALEREEYDVLREILSAHGIEILEAEPLPGGRWRLVLGDGSDGEAKPFEMEDSAREALSEAKPEMEKAAHLEALTVLVDDDAASLAVRLENETGESEPDSIGELLGGDEDDADFILPELPSIESLTIEADVLEAASSKDDDIVDETPSMEDGDEKEGAASPFLPPLEPPGSDTGVENESEPASFSDEDSALATWLAKGDTSLRVASMGTPRTNPFRTMSSDPRRRAERLARTLVSDMIAYRKEEHEKALKGGVDAIRKAFSQDIDDARANYYAQVGEDLAERDHIFVIAVNELLGNGLEVLPLADAKEVVKDS